MISCDIWGATNTAATGNNTGQYSSITIGRDGLPIISNYDATGGDLRVLKCEGSIPDSTSPVNPICQSGGAQDVIATSIDTTNNVGQYTSIAIGPDLSLIHI